MQMKRTIVAALAMLAFVNAARAEGDPMPAQVLSEFCAREKAAPAFHWYLCLTYVVAFLEGNEMAFLSLPEKTPRPYCVPTSIDIHIIPPLLVGQYKIAPTRDKRARELLFRTLMQSFPCPS